MHLFNQALHQSSANFNIVGIDPGTDTVGFSLYSYSPVAHCVVRSAATTLRGSKMIKYDPYVDVHGERARRISAIRETLAQMFLMHSPIAVVCEHPFYNQAMPGAFEPLVEGVGAVRGALFDYDPTMRVIPVDPSSAKKAIGASGGAKKDAMQVALFSIANTIAFDPNVFGQHLFELDEHSVDALAIGKWFINKLW